MVKMKGKRSLFDEKLIVDAQVSFIVDARKQTAAVANQIFRGGGVENNLNYSCELEFMGISNIHDVRESYSNFCQHLESFRANEEAGVEGDNFHTGIEKSAWLKYLKKILQAGHWVAKKLAAGSSVLVHCSDGWDRTAQICCIAEIILDPYYRTIEGLWVLICKDWLSFGHKFQDRIAHGIKKHDVEKSPVFLQFLDTIFQIWSQFPQEFEFNHTYLQMIMDHCHSCLFGDFLYNTEKDRRKHKLRLKTFSLWDYVEAHKDRFLNPGYLSSQKQIFPSTSYKDLRVWSYHYRDLGLGFSKEPAEDLLEVIGDLKAKLDRNANRN